MGSWSLDRVWSRGPRRRFCFRCLQGGPREVTLCPDCGETLLDQGYCPICEDYWSLRVGVACPKHEVDLAPEAAGRGRVMESGQSTALVTVRSFARSGEAEAARLRLEAEGIP